MRDVAVISACFGGYDNPRPAVEQTVDCDWLFVSDEGPAGLPRPWQSMKVQGAYRHPRMSAKLVKLQPWKFVAHGDVIWVDANMEITSPTFVADALAAAGGGPLATWRHPQRDCIYAEAAASLRLCPEKYGQLPLLEQVEHYRNEGYPEGAGLYACGTLVWAAQDTGARALGHAWLYECERWSYQDQLSLPVVATRLGIDVATFPVSQIEARKRDRRNPEVPPWLENRWLRIHPHLSAA